MIFIKNVLVRYQNFPNSAHADAIDRLTERVAGILQISKRITDNVEFLRTLLRDYIVLTR
jgi:hypothetical protein